VVVDWIQGQQLLSRPGDIHFAGIVLQSLYGQEGLVRQNA